MIDKSSKDNLKETLRLLNDKLSLKSLLDGHRNRDEGKEIIAKSPEEAFYDLKKKSL